MRLTGYWQVDAGVIPGLPTPELRRVFEYKSDLYDQDQAATDLQATHFARLMKEAHEYAQSITHPSRVNWVRLEWVWI